MELKTLEEKRDKEITGFFWLGLQIAFIFGIPAFLAVLAGKRLTAETGNNIYITLCLILSFIVSWIIVIVIYKKKSKRLKEIETEIVRLRKIDNDNKK